MKKTTWLTAAALLSAGALEHVQAQAQNSVTLYGRIDAGLKYMNGVPDDARPGGATHRFRAESGDWGTSLGASRARKTSAART